MGLKPDDYYTQNNNPTVTNKETGITVQPWAACMPTAYVMFLRGNGIAFENKSGLPDDAYLTSLLITREAVDFARRKYPHLSKYPPNEIHGMYGSYLGPKLTGLRVSDFMVSLSLNDVVERVRAGEVIMTSGRFMGTKAPIEGHAFCFIDYDGKDLLIADPFGNPWTLYVSKKGYNVRMSEDQFNAHAKPLGPNNAPTKLKWGHVVI